jgi:transcriptional regulator of arginine metabolism
MTTSRCSPHSYRSCSRAWTASASWSCFHTVASGAQPIAEAIDLEEFPEVLGTIAGDDTILIVTRSAGARVQLTERLRALAGEG